MNKLFRHSIDGWPVGGIVTGLLLSCLPVVFGLSVLTLLPAILGIVLRILVPIHQHYHSHLPTFRHSFSNFLYDVLLSVAGGNSTAVWKVHHCLGHHRDYLDQRNDVEGNLRFGEQIPFRRLVFTILGDSLSFYDAVRAAVQMPARQRRSHLLKMILEKTIFLSLIAALLVLNWKMTAAFIIVPNLFLGWWVFWSSYDQHDSLPMTNVYDSSTTLRRNTKYLLHVGLHTAHHKYPALHWSKLEEKTNEMSAHIPEICFRGRKSA